MALLHWLCIVSIAVPLHVVHGLSAADRQGVINCHNAYRSTLAKGTAVNKDGSKMPAGSNLLQFKYSTTVESTAQSWANQCSMSHSSGNYGENLYMTSSSTISDADVIKAACDSWWSELRNKGMDSSLVLTESNWYPVGHWSQQAWAKTGQIGCAVARCPSSTWKTYVVCNYDPPGNYMGEAIYQKGTACTACPSGSSCNATAGLCMMP